ncbi:MAG: peptidase, partial [Desulfuromonas sp.]
MKSIHIFKPGRHTAMNGKTINFSEADLKASAAAYDPKLHEAPLVIGHPRQDLPAYGWTKALSFSEGGLHADPDQVNAAFEEMVETGMFKKVSASFYLPNAPGNPVPGVYYLRHVGFLGAQPPAIKGLRPVEFAAGDEGAVTIEFGDWSDRTITRVLRRLKNFMIEKFGKEDADKMIDEWDLETLTEEAMRPEPPAVAANPEYSEKETDVLTKEQIEAKERELAAREEKLKKDNAAFAEREAQQRHGVNLAYAEGLVKAGKL